jgi:hypothetical protein
MAVAAYDRAVRHLLRFQPEVLQEAASAAAGGCVLGCLLGAYVGLMSTEAGAVAAAADALGPYAAPGADQSALHPRERAHLAAARSWIAGDMATAGTLLGSISISYPGDLLALAVGHQVDFFRGDAVNLRDRIGRALGAWPDDEQDKGFLYGMYAFGLEECNQYGQAAEAGARAVDTNPDDVWGIHAVVHTHEMQGQIPDGVRFMRARQADWANGNFLTVHNAWHYALYLLQGGEVKEGLAVYDTFLHHQDSADVALELLDATALLWRLQLEGTPVGDRWAPLAQAWTRILEPGFYPFNDMHAIMAYTATGQLGLAREVVAALERVVRAGDRRSTGWQMTASVGLPVCRGLLAFGAGDYPVAVAELLPVRTRVHEFGGSHAQRDAVQRTLLEAALRAGQDDLANALLSERLANRERSTYAWHKRALLLSRTGPAAAAAAAAAREDELVAEIRAAATA